MGTVLDEAQIAGFMERGHVLVEGAFPKQLAEEALDRVWATLAADRHDRSTWTQRFCHVQENFDGGPFAASWTDRVQGAIDDLLGAGRWRRRTAQGWWPVVFPGFDPGPWIAPAEGWHVDGQQFHHHLDSPDQGLLPIFVWSDIGPGDGGTALAEGSHNVTTRILAAAEPEGLSAYDLGRLVAAEPRPSMIEAQAMTGDVILLHPFMLHTSSPNTGDKVRFITNPCIGLLEPMRLHDPQSPVERSIVNALR